MELVVCDKRITFPRSQDEIIEFVLTSSAKQKMVKVNWDIVRHWKGSNSKNIAVLNINNIKIFRIENVKKY